jgi:hypothetical protein
VGARQDGVQRDDFNEKGKVFWAPEVSHSVPPDHVLFTSVTTLRHERAPVDHEAKERKIAWLKTLEGEDLKSGLVAMASELACDPADLAVRLSKSAQRYLREDAAREDWGKKVRVWMEQSPKRPPKSLPGLFKDAFNEGVSRRVCKDVIREAAAALMKISWSEAGAPKRG